MHNTQFNNTFPDTIMFGKIFFTMMELPIMVTFKDAFKISTFNKKYLQRTVMLIKN